MKIEEMRINISSHPYFLHEETQLQYLLNDSEHVCINYVAQVSL